MSLQILLFLVAGMLGGAVNVAAGGAKLFVFPILLAAGLPPVTANATGTLALFPAQIPGIWVFRDHLGGPRRSLAIDAAVVAIGAVTGAALLITMGEKTFVALVPLFLGVAVTSILFGERLARAARRLAGEGRGLARVVLCISGAYAGFFGAGLGFMLLAALMMGGEGDVHRATARKNLLACGANGTAAVPLALSGLVDWTAAAAVLVGGLAGGYLGALALRRVPAGALRVGIVVMGVVLTAAFLSR